MEAFNVNYLSYVFAFITVGLITCGASYRPQKVTLPADLSSVKIFTDQEIAKFDGSDVSL